MTKAAFPGGFFVPSRTIRIAGAGIAGLNAAIELARSGFSVEVHERKKRIGPSAGAHMEALRNYLGFDALDELQSYGVNVSPALKTTHLVRMAPNATSVLKGLSYYLMYRGSQDYSAENQLYRQALDLGVAVRFKSPVTEERVDIVATGAPADGVNMIAAGYQFTKEGANLPDDTVYALFDNRYAPHGYFVVVPGIEENSMYSASWTELRFDEIFRMVAAARKVPRISEAIGTARITGRIVGKAHYAPDPIENAVKNGRLYIGEAAGFQDATSAFGFRYACITGRLAAQSIAEGTDFRLLLRQTFRDEFERGIRARTMLSGITNDFYDWMLREMGEELTVEEYVEWRKTRPF
jgi:flavin-dependent dehydrogenase